MSDLDEILSQLPIDQIASSLGTDPDQIRDAASKAIPALVGGMQANAADGGEESLANALQQHAGNAPESLDDVDVADGSKIVNNVFGDNSDQVIQKLGGTTAGGGDLLKKLLPILAPMVMAFLAGKVFSGSHTPAPATTNTGAATGGDGSGPVDVPGNLGASGEASTTTADAGSGGLGDILGSVLGGSSTAGGASSSGGGLGDILGSILGGSSTADGASSSGGGLGDILGGLLGGGKK